MTDTTKPTKSRKWFLMRVLALVFLFALAAWYYVGLSRSIIPRGEVPKGIDTGKPYLEVALPSRARTGPNVGKQITFYIPRAYLKTADIYIKSGGLAEVPITFELPEKTPSSLAPPRPWQGLSYGSPESEALKNEFHTTHHGSFRLRLNFGTMSAEDFMRKKVNKTDPWDNGSTPIVQISTLAGLLRYAELDCVQPFAPGESEVYKKSRLQDIADKRAQGEPDDPPVPTNCAIDRRLVTLFTPLDRPEEQALYVSRCDLYSCVSFISVEGVDARIEIPLELLPRWREIVKPTQELLRSFLIKPASLP
jgi:hypothetical protein